MKQKEIKEDMMEYDKTDKASNDNILSEGMTGKRGGRGTINNLQKIRISQIRCEKSKSYRRSIRVKFVILPFHYFQIISLFENYFIIQ